MNRQEIFNICSEGLLKQNKKSMNHKDGICVYRSEDGCKCAAGFLIPDDQYDPKMESRYVYELNFFILNFPDDVDFINDIQRIHDIEQIKKWKQSLIDLARVHDLSLPPIFGEEFIPNDEDY